MGFPTVNHFKGGFTMGILAQEFPKISRPITSRNEHESLLYFFHDGRPYHIEIKWTGFCMIMTSVVKELNKQKNIKTVRSVFHSGTGITKWDNYYKVVLNICNVAKKAARSKSKSLQVCFYGFLILWSTLLNQEKLQSQV